MHYKADFHSHLEMEPNSLESQSSCLFSFFLESESTSSIFYRFEPYLGGFSLFQCIAGLSLMTLISLITVASLPLNVFVVTLSLLVFFSKLYILCFFLSHLTLFHCWFVDVLSLIIILQTQCYSVLTFPPPKKLVYYFFNLFLDKFLGHRQKTASFFAKITQVYPLAKLLLKSLLPSKPLDSSL